MKWIKIALFICVAASLVVFIRATDFEKVKNSIEQVGYRFLILILVTFLAYMLGTASWQYCLGEKFRAISLTRLFIIRHIGETVSLVNPASILGGEAVKAFLMRDYAVESKTAAASIIISRGIMIITQLLVFIAAVTVWELNSPGFYNSQAYLQKLSYILPLLILLAALLMSSRKFLKRAIKSLEPGNALRRSAGSLYRKLKEVWSELGVLFRHSRKKLFAAGIFAVMHWFVGALEFYFILRFIGSEVSIAQALIVDMGIIFFKTAGAFIPGQIGIEEYGNKLMLIAVGIPGTEIWVTASILRRARQLVWIAFGFGVYFLLVKKTGLPEPCADGSIVCKP